MLGQHDRPIGRGASIQKSGIEKVGAIQTYVHPKGVNRTVLDHYRFRTSEKKSLLESLESLLVEFMILLVSSYVSVVLHRVEEG